MIKKHITKNETETCEVAAPFAWTLNPGAVIALIGELGSGKTVFVKGLAKALGFKEQVTSPTFTLIHEYYGTVPLYHMDLFRVNSVQEMLDIGIEDYFYDNGICLVEWAEKLGMLLPKDTIRVTIRHLGDTRREINIERP